MSDAHNHLRIVTGRQPGFSLQKERGREGERGRGKKEGQRRGGRLERERETESERKERRKEDKGMTSLDFFKKIFFK